MKRRIIYLLFLTILISIPKEDFATDRNFGFTYESRTLQGGLKELEAYVTYKYGREDYYSSLENRLEFEIGLGKKLQTAFYLNLKAQTSPVSFTNAGIGTNGELVLVEYSELRTKANIGFSNEWKYQLSDPSVNKIGSALYGEYTIATDEFELEGKIILDKSFNRFVTALNLTGELEWEAEHNELNTVYNLETKVQLDYGLSYHFSKNISGGFELRNSNVIEHGDWEHSALYAGPVFSYSQESWWMTLTIMPQVTDLIGSGLTLEDDEKVNARLLFSYLF